MMDDSEKQWLDSVSSAVERLLDIGSKNLMVPKLIRDDLRGHLDGILAKRVIVESRQRL